MTARPLPRLALAVVLAFVLACTAVVAQDVNQPNYQAWEAFSSDVAETLDEGATIDELENLRSRVARYRTDFLTAQDTNSARIQALQGQIDNLGPPPGEGDPAEPLPARQRRDALNSQLQSLRQPVATAEEAYSEADGLVAEIDRTIRDRYAEQILAREPSPLNPVYWSGAISAVVDTGLVLVEELASGWDVPSERRRAFETLPITLPLAGIGLLLLFRSTWWVRLFESWAVSHTYRGRGVVSFGLSLGQLILPLVGVQLFAYAVRISGVGGPAVSELAGLLWLVALPIVVGQWLTRMLLPVDPERTGILDIGRIRRQRLRFYGDAMAVTVSVRVAIEIMAELTDREDIAISVLLYVPRIALAFLLYRTGRILIRSRTPDTEQEESRGLAASFTGILGRFVMVVAVIGALLATAGYANATSFILIPAVETLALTASLLLLQRLVYDLYALMTGTQEGQTDALAPVLIGFALTLAALPIYALIWGARIADLTEMWTRFRTGIVLGESRISPTDFITFLVVFIIGYTLTRFVQSTLRGSVLPKTQIDIGGRNAITAGIGYIGIFIAVVAAVTSAGIDLSSLAIVAGALSVGIGFGLQTVVSNFVAGIILLIERPISEGDWIEVSGQMGYVRDISVRSTRIETFDRTDVIVPNADLVSNSVINWTRGNLVGRVIAPVTVAFGSDTRKVERILQEVGEAHSIVSLNPRPFVYFIGFGENGLRFELRAILRDVNWILEVHNDLNHEIARRFAEEGIEIPFPPRDLWLRNPETLRGTSASQEQRSTRPMPGGPESEGDAQ